MKYHPDIVMECLQTQLSSTYDITEEAPHMLSVPMALSHRCLVK